MKPNLVTSLCLATATCSGGAEEYELTDITGWTPAQLATLPHFDRYVPVVPAGATGDFTPVCSNGRGLVAGDRSDSNGNDGAVVSGGTQADIGAWGRWNWSYWQFDGQDNHYYWGSVERSPVAAANLLGQVLGHANLGGGSSGFATRNDYHDHIYIYDPATGGKSDLTPGAHRCAARDLNDRGEVTGYWSDDTSYHPFRRSADGAFTDFVFNQPFSHNIGPSVINNHGHVAGMVTVWTTPRDYIPWFSASGSTTIALPYPDQDNAYNGAINDINDHDVIVGYYHKADTPLETTALRWTEQGGTWTAEQLVELLVDNFDFILDRALAVNDAGHIICSGHADGGPDNAFNTHRFLLTPLEFAPPAVTTLAAVAVTSTGATLRAKINPGNLATSGDFQHGSSTGYGSDTPLAPASGTLPTLAELPLGGLTPHTTYHFRATATNPRGTSDGADATFTTAWDWTSWATATLGATDPAADANLNGLPDGIDYATGNAAPPRCIVDAGRLQFSFRRSLVADGVTLVVQVSNDLVNWNDGSSYSISGSTPDNAFTSELSRTADGPDGELVTVAADASEPARFVRLKALMP